MEVLKLNQLPKSIARINESRVFVDQKFLNVVLRIFIVARFKKIQYFKVYGPQRLNL